jgi:PadR family transcriptional regulator PadR
MKRRQGTIGEFEQLVLLAILQLKSEAYGPNISRELECKAGRRVSRGALYSSLDRLQQPKRRFEVTRAGIAALREYRKALTRLWVGLEEVLG